MCLSIVKVERWGAENAGRALSKMLGHDRTIAFGTLCQVLRHDRANIVRTLCPVLGTDRRALGMHS